MKYLLILLLLAPINIGCNADLLFNEDAAIQEEENRLLSDKERISKLEGKIESLEESFKKQHDAMLILTAAMAKMNEENIRIEHEINKLGARWLEGKLVLPDGEEGGEESKSE